MFIWSQNECHWSHGVMKEYLFLPYFIRYIYTFPGLDLQKINHGNSLDLSGDLGPTVIHWARVSKWENFGSQSNLGKIRSERGKSGPIVEEKYESLRLRSH
jgi:hypothetical protein